MSVEESQPVATAVPVLEYATARMVPRPWGKGFLAVMGTLVIPGLGHLLARYRRRALFWFGMTIWVTIAFYAALLRPAWLPGVLVIVPMGAILSLAALVDAFLCGRRSPRPMLGRWWARYLAGLVLIAAALFVNPFSFSSKSLAYYVRDHYVEAFQVGSGAMSPTVKAGDMILAHKKVPWTRWDIVVFDHPQMGGTRTISRVVGLPGETVEIVEGQVRINGKAQTPPPGVGPYVNVPFMGSHDNRLRGKPGTGCTGNPIFLRNDEYYLLSDNSQAAIDSRLWEVPIPGHQRGAITAKEILGKATYIHWPPDRWRSLSP